MNALHPPANAELGEVFDAFAADDDMWVAIITGEGRGFSAGNDLRYQAEGGERIATPSGFGGLTSRFDLTKPVVAAVNGVSMGGGFEIALACDLIIASDRAVFALPEPKVGLAALAGGLQRLPRQIGVKRALGMILTGRHVTPEEGLQLGFVNAVVPHDELMSETRRWVDMISRVCATLNARKAKMWSTAAHPWIHSKNPCECDMNRFTPFRQAKTLLKDHGLLPRNDHRTGKENNNL